MRLTLFLAIACGRSDPVAPEAPVAPPKPAAAEAAAGPVRVAKVVEVLDASPHYTYARMDACGEEAWVAGPRIRIEPGQTLEMVGGQALVDFESEALGRTFDVLLMVDRWSVAAKPLDCAPPSSEPLRFGTIKQILSASSYTYLELDVCGETVWVAGPERRGLEVGGLVGTPEGIKKERFYSKSLNMTFEPIYFVDWIKKARALPPCPPG